MKIFLIFTILGLTVLAVKAQPPQIINPSPNMTSFTSLINAGVGYYTGTPQIGLPLLSLPTTQGNIPISLAYNSAGIRVDDVASTLGLGWNLISGGQITRVVRGREDVYSTVPDEYGYDNYGTQNDGFYRVPDSTETVSPYGSIFGPGEAWNYIEDYVIGGHSEPDLFYLSAPGLGVIRFTLNNDFIPVLLPYRAIKFVQEGIRNNGWKIIDENGIKYEFGTSTREKTTITITGDIALPSTSSFVSTWYLDKITYPTGEIVDYTYTGIYGNITETSTNKIYRKIQYSTTFIDEYKNYTYTTVVEPKYITKIKSNFGQIDFYYSGTRQDLTNGARLDRISLSGRTLQLKSEIKLAFGYADANDALAAYNILNAGGDMFQLGNTGEEYFRLKLLNISRVTNGVQKKLWDFEYLSGLDESGTRILDLPARKMNNPHTDHYGYSQFGLNSYGGTPYIPGITGPANHYMNPNNSAKAGLLYKIISNESSITEYDYEVVEKVRVKSITQKKNVNDTDPLATIYSYGTPYAANKPVYYFQTPWLGSEVRFAMEYSSYPNSSKQYTEIYMNSRNALYDLNGVSHGYSSVSVINPDGSKKTMEFSNFNNSNEDDEDPEIYAVLMIDNFPGGFNLTGPPYSPSTDRSWRRGNIKKISLFNSKGDKYYEKNIQYEYDETNLPLAVGRVASTLFQIGGYNKMIGGTYMLQSEKYRIQYETEYTFDMDFPGDITKSLKFTKIYTYNNINQIIKISNGPINEAGFVTEFKYPYDFGPFSASQGTNILYNGAPGARGVLKLIQDHQYNRLIETRNYHSSGQTKTFLSSTLNEYRIWSGNGKAMPYSVSKSTSSGSVYTEASITGLGFSTDASLEKVQVFSDFESSNAKPKKAVANGVTTDYSWSNNGTNLSQVTSSSGGLSWSTEYVNIPFVGPKGITDSNGIITYYKYDKQNRLKLIKNSNDEIVTRYRYNTKENLTGSILTSGTYQTNTSVSLTGVDPFDYGESSYSWDFGDGTVVENASLSTSHVYTNPGTYTVKLVITNPEYEYLLVTKTVSIYEPFSGGLILSNNNPIVGGINLCSLSPPEKIYDNLSIANVQGGGALESTQWYFINGSGQPMLISAAYGTTINTPGTYTIRCKLTNIYGDVFTIDKTITASNSGCSGGGDEFPNPQ